MDQKNKALRESETNLKMVQNDLELAQSQNTSTEMKNKQQADKIRDLEQKINQSKEQIFSAEKLKEQQQIEYESKIEMLKQKLLNKIGDEVSANSFQSNGMND